jgi:hypothetical protein
MKYRVMAGAFALAWLLTASQAGAARCRGGEASTPEHPCEDDSDAAETAAARYETQWKTLSGVMDVSAALSDHIHKMVLEVSVDPPSLIPAIKAVLPTEADGFPVEVVPMETGTTAGIYLVPGVFDTGGADASTENSPTPADDQNSDPPSDDAEAPAPE